MGDLRRAQTNGCAVKEPTNPENDPYAIINALSGIASYGTIDAVASRVAKVPPGELRLYNGFPGPRGWGWRHITCNPSRVALIKRAGYATPQAFAYAVGQGWRTLHAGPGGPAIRITVALAPKDGLQPAIALNWSGRYWSITTMLPFRTVNYPKLYEK